MALDTLVPFNYGNFYSVNFKFIQNLIFYYEKIKPGFWYSLLKNYNFEGKGFKDGEAKRFRFHELLKKADGVKLVDVANLIMDWGNMKVVNEDMACSLQNSLDVLDRLSNGCLNDFEDVREVCVRRIASITKIYEMWDLDNWIIYDSYCVRGLQWFISNFWQFPKHEINKKYLLFPWPRGRKGEPVDGFPYIGDSAPRQKQLGFIYSSWLCKCMANVLNRICFSHMQWRTFHVEMLAFQKGHEI